MDKMCWELEFLPVSLMFSVIYRVTETNAGRDH